jgi:molecular chaperone GrpE
MTQENQEPTSKPEDPTPEGPSEEQLHAQMQADLERFRDLALRSQADFDNFRKRAVREKEDAIKYSNGSFLERLLPILDNFELGLTAARADTGAGAILDGLEMVSRQLQDFLRDCGVEPVEAEPGTPFDPNVHEAVGQQESAKIPEGAVLQQLRKGFKLRDRLLRPAMVMVSKGKGAA